MHINKRVVWKPNWEKLKYFPVMKSREKLKHALEDKSQILLVG